MTYDYKLDLSNLSNELQLILEMFRESNEPLKNKKLDNFDWRLFLDLAAHHRIYPVMYTKTDELRQLGAPSFVFEHLSQAYQRNTFDMMALCGEMEKVSKEFAAKQIPLLFLKGPILAAELYGDLSLRTSKDLDVLIPDTHVEEADLVLQRLGYEKEITKSFMNDWKWRNHHIVYFHPEKKIMVELHLRLEPYPIKQPSFAELWKTKRVSEITSFPVYYLGKEALFAYLVSHGARHGWFRLRWLLDIHQFLQKEIDCEKMLLAFKKYDKNSVAGQALLLTASFFHTPIQKELRALLEKEEAILLAEKAVYYISRIQTLAELSASTDFKEYSKLLIGKRHLLRIPLYFYPSYSDYEMLKLPKPLYFLYFPLRPLFVVTRRIKRQSVKKADA